MAGRVAFVCAMPMELAPLRRNVPLQRSLVGALDAYTGQLAGRPVVATVTGMGTALATAGVERLVEAVEVERVVVVGITGAVDDATPIGTLIRPEVVVDAATGDEYRPEQLGGGTPTGKMWTTDSLTTDPDVLAELRAAGVVSLDMETAAVAEVCERRGIAWSVFRVISDRATDGSVDDEVFHLSNQDGTPDARAVAAYLRKHPGRGPARPRWPWAAELATESAARAAVDAVSRLPPPAP
jgi:nucleoside phosphorylase